MKIEIKNAPTSEIDWSKDQQLVETNTNQTNQKSVVLTTGGNPTREDCFCGVDLPTGHYSSGWIKIFFKPFNGEITLKND